MTRKILIADDEPNIVISLEFLMKKEGFQVAVAGDGEEAMAKVAEAVGVAAHRASQGFSALLD